MFAPKKWQRDVTHGKKKIDFWSTFWRMFWALRNDGAS